MINATTEQTFMPSKAMAKYIGSRFMHALKADIEFGGLNVLRWRIAREETLQSAEDHELLPLAKQIEARWTVIEMEYGQGALLVEEDEIAQMLALPGGRFQKEPHLLENARRLRELKGQGWWTREHQLGSLAEELRSRNLQPYTDRI